MNPYIAARHQPARPAPMSRIDLLLAMYDGAIERLQTARELLKAGHRLAGPAIVDQLDTTTLIPPGYAGEVDTFGNIVLRRMDRP